MKPRDSCHLCKFINSRWGKFSCASTSKLSLLLAQTSDGFIPTVLPGTYIFNIATPVTHTTTDTMHSQCNGRCLYATREVRQTNTSEAFLMGAGKSLRCPVTSPDVVSEGMCQGGGIVFGVLISKRFQQPPDISSSTSCWWLIDCQEHM